MNYIWIIYLDKKIIININYLYKIKYNSQSDNSIASITLDNFKNLSSMWKSVQFIINFFN